MGIPNSQLRALIGAGIAEADHNLVLDPLGVAGGNVFTDYGLCVNAAIALPGLVRIQLLNDVTVATGSFGLGVETIAFVGSIVTGVATRLVFTGDAQHTSAPRYFDSVDVVVEGTATEIPFLLGAAIFPINFIEAKFSRFIPDAPGALPVFSSSTPGAFIFLLMIGGAIEDEAATPAVSMTNGSILQISALFDPVSPSVVIAGDSIAADAGSAVSIFRSDAWNSNPLETYPLVLTAGGITERNVPGTSAPYFATLGSGQNIKPFANGRFHLTAAPPYTIDVDVSSWEFNEGNFLIFTTNLLTAGDDEYTVELMGATFLGGGTVRTLRWPRGEWRLELREDSTVFALVGPEGVVEQSDKGPLHVEATGSTSGAATLDIHTRAVATDGDLVGIEADVWGVVPGGTNKYFRYKVSGVAQRLGGTVALQPSGTEVTTIYESDAAASCTLVTDGSSNVSIRVLGTAGDSIGWRARIRYTQVRAT